MAYEPKDMSGSLFKNDKREKDTHPNAKGSALIEGVEYWVDAWTNEDRNGNKYQALKFKRKDSGGGFGATTQRNAPPPVQDLDDDVPFATSDAAQEWKVG